MTSSTSSSSSSPSALGVVTATSPVAVPVALAGGACVKETRAVRDREQTVGRDSGIDVWGYRGHRKRIGGASILHRLNRLEVTIRVDSHLESARQVASTVPGCHLGFTKRAVSIIHTIEKTLLFEANHDHFFQQQYNIPLKETRRILVIKLRHSVRRSYLYICVNPC
jgi:hypothetical protein